MNLEPLSPDATRGVQVPEYQLGYTWFSVRDETDRRYISFRVDLSLNRLFPQILLLQVYSIILQVSDLDVPVPWILA